MAEHPWMRRIFNYELQADGRQVVQIHKGADVLGVIVKYGRPFLLAVVDERQPFEQRVFRIVTTGEWFNHERLWYIGTARLGGEGSEPWYTAHVFEIETALPQLHPDPVEDRFKADQALLRTEYRGEDLVARDEAKATA